MSEILVKMSPKGQLVVPQEIREIEAFEPGDRFIPFPVKEESYLKELKYPTLR